MTSVSFYKGASNLNLFFQDNCLKLLKNYLTFFSSKVDRDHRIVGAGKIIGKLEKQWIYCQKQQNAEKDGPFQHVPYNKSLMCHVSQGKINGYSIGVCHAQGRRPSMEDQHLAESFNITIQDKTYPVKLFGVFDGHGGALASKFAKENLTQKLQEALLEFNPKELTDEGVWNALKLAFVRLSDDFKKTGLEDGTTATVTLILDEKLWTANVGDSRTILENKEVGIIQLSEDAKPDDARYKKGIKKRGGKVLNVHGTPRINGNLAVGRALGDLSVGKGMNARPKITMIPLSKIKPGSHLILACDGIYDVASTRQIGKVVADHSNRSPHDLAKDIVYSAYQAGSGDNLTVFVIQFPAQEMPKPRYIAYLDFGKWLGL